MSNPASRSNSPRWIRRRTPSWRGASAFIRTATDSPPRLSASTARTTCSNASTNPHPGSTYGPIFVSVARHSHIPFKLSGYSRERRLQTGTYLLGHIHRGANSVDYREEPNSKREQFDRMTYTAKLPWAASAISFLAIPLSFPRLAAQTTAKPTFEVATIKLAAPNAVPKNQAVQVSPTRLSIASMSLSWLIYTAYGDGGFNT